MKLPDCWLVDSTASKPCYRGRIGSISIYSMPAGVCMLGQYGSLLIARPKELPNLAENLQKNSQKNWND